MLKVYAYQGCSTCKNAIKWLKKAAIDFEEVPIRQTPPSVEELKAMLAACRNERRLLCNTSGADYRALGLKDKLDAMSVEELLTLLSENGNLVKRPFVIDIPRGIFLLGFREPEWTAALT